jgi:CheY-like chemotaxis protein
MAPSPAVLVADDSAVARLAIVRRLQAEGIAVVERDSAAGARAVDPATVTCALLDLDLGDGDGAEVALALQARSPAMPIAFFSAHAAPDVLERAQAIGPVFQKPGELDEAITWVRVNVA